MALYLTSERSEPIDTNSGMTPFHDESGRTFTTYYLEEIPEGREIPHSAIEVILRPRLTVPDCSKLGGTHLHAIYDCDQRARSSHGSDLKFVRCRWRKFYQSDDKLHEYELSLEREDIVDVIRSVLKETADVLGLAIPEDISEEEMMWYDQHRLLGTYATYIGRAGATFIYYLPIGSFYFDHSGHLQAHQQPIVIALGPLAI